MTTLKTLNRFYVYGHFRPGSKIPFYVGKGSKRRIEVTYRNLYWQRIVKKYGYEFKIIESNLTEFDAFDKEKKLIENYKKLGGREANLSSGGEGCSGYKWTENQRKKISDIQKSQSETIKNGHIKQAAKLKGRTKFNHPGIKAISENNSGEKNGRAIWNIITPDGEFATIKETSRFYGISTATVHQRIASSSIQFKAWRKDKKESK